MLSEKWNTCVLWLWCEYCDVKRDVCWTGWWTWNFICFLFKCYSGKQILNTVINFNGGLVSYFSSKAYLISVVQTSKSWCYGYQGDWFPNCLGPVPEVTTVVFKERVRSALSLLPGFAFLFVPQSFPVAYHFLMVLLTDSTFWGWASAIKGCRIEYELRELVNSLSNHICQWIMISEISLNVRWDGRLFRVRALVWRQRRHRQIHLCI